MKYLAEFRKKCSLTQANLAEKVNVSTNSIARYERGELTPTVEIANKIAEVLGTTVNELLNGPVSENWELKIKLAKEGVIEVGTMGTAFDLSVGNTAMAVTVSGSYDIWEDEAKFEAQIISELRKKRQAGLNLHKEAF